MRQLVHILRRFDMVQVVKLRKSEQNLKVFANRVFEANKFAQAESFRNLLTWPERAFSCGSVFKSLNCHGEIGLEEIAETFTNAEGCHVLARKKPDANNLQRLASKQTVFTVYEAKLIPMPYPDDPQSALTWNVEAPYLALSEDHMESSVLSAEQFEHCLVSSRYRICSESVPLEKGHSSCLATLYSSTASEALAVYDTTIVQLSAIEQATILGYGIWLIQSAHVVTLREVSSSSVKGSSFCGCRIYLITLACGMQIMTDNMKIRSDLSSCAHIPPIEMQVSLPNPIASLVMEVPRLKDLPFYTSKAEAGVNLLKEVELQLAKGPKNREVNILSTLQDHMHPK